MSFPKEQKKNTSVTECVQSRRKPVTDLKSLCRNDHIKGPKFKIIRINEQKKLRCQSVMNVEQISIYGHLVLAQRVHKVQGRFPSAGFQNTPIKGEMAFSWGKGTEGAAKK